MLTVRNEQRVWISDDCVLRRFEVMLGFGGGATIVDHWA
jgi:hypothetical protein